MSEDPELAEFEERRRANRKTLAIIGLVLVGGILLWRCTSLVDRFGVGTGGRNATVQPEGLELTIARDGQVSARGCSSDLDDCIARAKVRENNRAGGGNYRVVIHVAPGAPQVVVAEVRTLVEQYELTPVLD